MIKNKSKHMSYCNAVVLSTFYICFLVCLDPNFHFAMSQLLSMHWLTLFPVAVGASVLATVYASVTAFVCDHGRCSFSDCLYDHCPFSCLTMVTVTVTVMMSVTVVWVMDS